MRLSDAPDRYFWRAAFIGFAALLMAAFCIYDVSLIAIGPCLTIWQSLVLVSLYTALPFGALGAINGLAFIGNWLIEQCGHEEDEEQPA